MIAILHKHSPKKKVWIYGRRHKTKAVNVALVSPPLTAPAQDYVASEVGKHLTYITALWKLISMISALCRYFTFLKSAQIFFLLPAPINALGGERV